MGIGGTQEGLRQNGRSVYGFFGVVGPHVDLSKGPGESHIRPPTSLDFLWELVSLRIIYNTPNLVWLAITLALYTFFPYDLHPTNSAAAVGPISVAFFKERLGLWFVVIGGYYLYWHATLYGLNWCQRPFIPNRTYKVMKVLHNLAYLTEGVVTWTAFENVFCFLWATGRLPYMTDAAAFASWKGQAVFWAGLVLIPQWRDFHFYFAHRLLHFRPNYMFVHSLHHRNTDVEPFSGLCMHPVEHLYYYACVLPNLLPMLSPSSFLFNGIHLTLAPAASHSGYEDHWQSDHFHYCHHRYFEMNYAGWGAAFLDYWFGSFWGEGWKKEKGPIAVRDDAKATANLLAQPPSVETVVYMATSCGCVLAWAVAACGMWGVYVAPVAAKLPVVGAMLSTPPSLWWLGVAAGFGPTVIALVWAIAKEGPGVTIKPFERRPAWETVLHLVIGTIFCPLSVTLTCWLCM